MNIPIHEKDGKRNIHVMHEDYEHPIQLGDIDEKPHTGLPKLNTHGTLYNSTYSKISSTLQVSPTTLKDTAKPSTTSAKQWEKRHVWKDHKSKKSQSNSSPWCPSPNFRTGEYGGTTV